MHTLLTNCTLIDGLGNAPVENARVLIFGDRIDRVGTEADTDQVPGTEVIDLGGGFVLPGLISTHVHLSDVWPHPEPDNEPTTVKTIRAGRNALEGLRSGITSMRSLGEDQFIDVAWRSAFEEGHLQGPTLVASGNAIIAPGGHAHFMKRNIGVRGVAAITAEVERQIDHGVDCIKLVTTAGETIDEGVGFGELQFSMEEVRAVVDTAHAAGKQVCTHTGTAEGVIQAVEAGVDCIEHGYVLDQHSVELLVENNIFLTPTLSVTHNETFYDMVDMEEAQRDKFRRIRDRHTESFRIAYDAGVRITCGADNNPIGFCTLSEIEMMVEYGMSETDAISAATIVSAEAIGLAEERGAITNGRIADLLVLGSDPLQDIRNIRDTRLVLKSGRPVQPLTGPTSAAQRQ